MRNKYYCQVYKYDQDGRNLIRQTNIFDIRAYAKHLNRTTLDWDEFEFGKESDIVSTMEGSDNSQFLGKVVNPKSSNIIIAEG